MNTSQSFLTVFDPTNCTVYLTLLALNLILIAFIFLNFLKSLIFLRIFILEFWFPLNIRIRDNTLLATWWESNHFQGASLTSPSAWIIHFQIFHSLDFPKKLGFSQLINGIVVALFFSDKKSIFSIQFSLKL